MAIQATPKPIGHHHGKKSNSRRAGNRWGPKTLRRHLQDAHGESVAYGAGLEAMRQQHKTIHNEAPHTHDAKVGPPWTLDGLIGHLNKRHAKEFHAIIERDGLVVMDLYLDAARLIHDEVHGGTQLKPETKAPMGTGGITKNYRTLEEQHKLTQQTVKVRNETDRDEIILSEEEAGDSIYLDKSILTGKNERRVDWRFRDALIAAGMVFMTGLWIGYALARNLWP